MRDWNSSREINKRPAGPLALPPGGPVQVTFSTSFSGRRPLCNYTCSVELWWRLGVYRSYCRGDTRPVLAVLKQVGIIIAALVSTELHSAAAMANLQAGRGVPDRHPGPVGGDPLAAVQSGRRTLLQVATVISGFRILTCWSLQTAAHRHLPGRSHAAEEVRHPAQPLRPGQTDTRHAAAAAPQVALNPY